MLKNFKKHLVSLHNMQSQIQQNGHYSTPEEYSLNGSSQFTLAASALHGVNLYHKNGLPPLPTHPLSSYLADERQVRIAQASGRVVPTTATEVTSLENLAKAYSGVLYSIPLV